MKELVKHIEILLLDNDCVVVPQIGGFVTRDVPAKYIEEENLFLPPIRTVGFNDRLKADDGLLVRSYVLAYRCSEAEAKKMLGEQLRDLQQELWETGTYDLGSIGVLTLDGQSNIQFSPCQAGVVCPDYYGLDALLFAPLQEDETPQEVAEPVLVQMPASEVPQVRLEVEIPKSRNEITIRLKKTWFQGVAAVAAVVSLFFLMSPDAKNTGYTSGEHAEFTRLMLPVIQDTVAVEFVESQPVQGVEEKADAVHVGADTPVSTVENQGDVHATVACGGYCVVVASAIPEKNAYDYVERLHKQGYTEAQVYKKGNMIRVIFPGYASEAEARAKMNALSNSSEEFALAWVYHIK